MVVAKKSSAQTDQRNRPMGALNMVIQLVDKIINYRKSDRPRISLSQIRDGDGIHVRIGIVLAGHAPDECIVAGTAPGVHGPWRRNNGLPVRYEQMARLLWLTHDVKNTLAFRNIEIKIGLHPTGMSMRRHRIPDAARLEYGEPHYELTALNAVGMDIFIDGARIGSLRRTGLHGHRLFLWEELYWIFRMRGRGQAIKTGRTRRVVAFKNDLPNALTRIQTFQPPDGVRLIVRIDLPVTADIDDADLPALQKEIGPQLGMGFQPEPLFCRAGAPDDDAVVMRIDEMHGIRLHQAFGEESAPQLFGAHALYFLRAMFESDIHILNLSLHPPSLSPHPASIDGQDRSMHVIRGRTGQKNGGSLKIVGLAPTAGRYPVQYGFAANGVVAQCFRIV